jgi:ABC-type uncharacterized transport system substrate-binding protein
MQRFLTFLVLIICGYYPSQLMGHPHAWITLSSSFVLDNQSRLVAIRQSWEFDTPYSTIALSNIKNEYKDEKKGLQHTAEKFINSLKSYQYFSFLNIEGAMLLLNKPTLYKLSRLSKTKPFTLKLDMHFKLDKPVVIQNKTLTWSVFDPTFFVAMNHKNLESVTIIGNSSIKCRKKLIDPTPSKQTSIYAQGLDRNQKAKKSLGESFAEKVHINCSWRK